MRAGRTLDRFIARLLAGDAAIPLYSTEPAAAGALLRRLLEEEIVSSVLHEDGVWYCRLFRDGETVATGSGRTRELAIARGAANVSRALLLPRPVPGWREAAPESPAVTCEACGRPIEPKSAGARRLCNPCRYWQMKAAASASPEAGTAEASPPQPGVVAGTVIGSLTTNVV